MNEDPEKLESLVDSALRGQPTRRAPPGLEARVLARIEARAESQADHGSLVGSGSVGAGGSTLASGSGTAGSGLWWRRSFAHWPLAARVGFLVASYGFVRLVLAGVMYATASVESGVQSGGVVGALSPAVIWLHAGTSIFSAVASAVVFVARVIPPYWLYGAAAFGMALYVALFGIGTVAYRTLYADK